MNTFYEKSGYGYTDENKIGSGGEGNVFKVRDKNGNNLCMKIYHDINYAKSIEEKIDFLSKHVPPQKNAKILLCWPICTLYDKRKVFAGFLMPLASENSEKLYSIIHPNMDLDNDWSKFKWEHNEFLITRLKLCLNIAVVIDVIHSTGKYVLHDLKPENIHIENTGRISLIDCDSIQINANGIQFATSMVTPEYLPPEGHDPQIKNKLKDTTWDIFGSAVIFYQVLFGIHPYSVTPYIDISTTSEKIKEGFFAHGQRKAEIRVIPENHHKFNHLPKQIQKLFIDSFSSNQRSRPTIHNWGADLYFVAECYNSFKHSLSQDHTNISIISNLNNSIESHKSENTKLSEQLKKSQILFIISIIAIIILVIIIIINWKKE